MSVDNLAPSESSRRLGQLNSQVESFIVHLRAAGYAERTVYKKRLVMASFARWTTRKRLGLADLNESHGATFAKRSPRRSKARVVFELAVLRLFFGYLRLATGTPIPVVAIESSPVDDLHRRYVDYLRNQRGLAENSIRVYSPYIHDFLTEVEARSGTVSLSGLNATTVQDFLMDRIQDRSSEYMRLLATALRSFLRFLYFCEETEIDLSASIPTVRKWRQATVPAFLSPDEVELVLSTVDRRTPRGCRDYAVLLLLARLGLRAGEIVVLELGDIDWRTGEIAIHGKARVQDRLPLVSDVGEALTLYLSNDRGHSSSRRVFLRLYAPCVGLAGPAAIGHIVRGAFARAGLHRTGRGAAHLFRHSLATRMIRHGASIAEISEVLRHRCKNTTEIYTKVAFEALRGVARPWPGTGGAR